MNLKIDSDAFSAGQVESKIWAAEELEKIYAHTTILRISILGGWYGLFHFILKARNRQMVEWCRSYDIDTGACSIANSLNNTWEDEWKFRSIPKDANDLKFNDDTNCVINTSTEHFNSKDWYNRIPKGTICLFQGNDLEIEDHVNRPTSLGQFKSMWPLDTILFEGTKFFNFKKDPYTRYMIIGHK